MARKNRTPEENARREKIRELLQMANIGSMEDIQGLFKETIAEFMENGLEAELDDELETITIQQATWPRASPFATRRRSYRIQTRLRPFDILYSFPPSTKQDSGVSFAWQHLCS